MSIAPKINIAGLLKNAALMKGDAIANIGI